MQTQSKPKCKAKRKRTKEPCGNYPLPGMDVCRMHGGSAPQAKEAAARRLATQAIQQSAEATISHMGLEPVEDPLAELGKLASASKAMMEALGARVNSLQDLSEYSKLEAPTIRAEVQMYERALDRTHRLLDSLIKAGYTERQVSIAEQEALLVSGVIRRVLSSLGLSPAQLTQAQHLLADEFRALEAR
jgi:hypothetical protein